MRNKLIAALAVLSLGSAAIVAILATDASAQAPNPNNPVQLAQVPPAAPPGRGPAARGPNARGPNNTLPRPAPTAADRTARRNDICQEISARAAGRLAYLENRLNLTTAQSGAFNRWRDQRLAAAKSRAADCTARPLPPQAAPQAARGRGANAAAAPPSPVERLARQETMLQRRLADIQAERPALDALWSGLNADQRQIFQREAGRGGIGRGGIGRGGLGRGGFGGRGFGPRGGMMMRRGGMRGGPAGMSGPEGSGRPLMGPRAMGRQQLAPPPGNPPPQ
ncbi:MAG: Spy/CpxP family protein refolding chaperone [Alphaproteobacteria bacterium]|nr:Spy/CpxP family protein refolding chaperone [Alphaproteobacteria bacterium]